MKRPGGWLNSPRRASARTRLTATFSGLLLIVGASIVVSVLLVMRYVPRYEIVAMRAMPQDFQMSDTTKGLPSSTLPAQPNVDESAFAAPLGVSITGQDSLLTVLLTTSVIVFAVAVVAGTWLSWVVAGRVLRPLDHLTRAAREAELGHQASDDTHTHWRIALAGPHDEFHRLATTFDDMLERLDVSYEAQRRFAANASHELRTPLATTQAMLDVALADTSSVDVPELGRRLREMNTRSMNAVTALLTLAETESGEHRDEPVDLRAIVSGILRETQVHDMSEPPTILPHLEPAVVTGDAALLTALVRNLLDNAAKHGGPGGTIDVQLAANTLTISNGGDTIEAAEVARLTEPFYRRAGRIARSPGLGLAIVAAICTRHEATLGLSARQGGGLTVQVTFPEHSSTRDPQA